VERKKLREKKGNAKSREAVGGKDDAEEERGAGETRREGNGGVTDGTFDTRCTSSIQSPR